MSNDIPSEINAKFLAKYDWLKNEQFPSIGDPDAKGIHQIAVGIWACHYGNTANSDWCGCTIVVRAGDAETREVHGKICERWLQEGGALGWLGCPISDEEVYEDDGDPLDRISHFENGDIICTSKTVSTRIFNIKERGRWYEFRRNELLILLKEASALNVPEKYSDELRQSMRKCQENAFEIALVGEFQGGKSTTFNALCDGRDISPRGSGIKTSAAVVTAQNIAGNETKDGLAEWAEVSFKSPDEISLGISTILRGELVDSEELRSLNSNLSNEEYEDFIDTDDGFPRLADLRRPEILNLLRSTADGLWRKWESNKANWAHDRLDQLRIATLQLRFFGTDGQKELAKKTTLPINQFQKLAAFPRDWETRWRDGGNAHFEFDEVAFVFVHSVLVRLHSENLQRLGCRITDCPGLFANAFDTSVAESAIRHADAVWYLYYGEKQLGGDDKKTIQQIAHWGLDGKIQTTANIWSDWEFKSTVILDESKSTLTNMGLTLDVIPYNARLAFLATQGELLLKRPDMFSELDETNMRLDAKAKDEASSLSSIWVKMVRKVGNRIDDENLANIGELASASVESARHSSQLDVIISRLNNDIIPLKAESILVNRGSDRAAKALSVYEGVLRASEKAAEEKEAEWRTKVETARNELKSFVEGAHSIVERSVLGENLDSKVNSLARLILGLALGERLVTDLSYHLAESTANAGLHLSIEKLAQTIKRDVTPKFAGALKGAMSRALEQWRQGDGVGQLRKSLALVRNDIHKLWTERKINERELLDGFEPPSIPEEDIGELCDDLSQVLLVNRQVIDIVHDATNLKTFFLNIFQNLWDYLLWFFAQLAKILVIDPSAPEKTKIAKQQQRVALIGGLAAQFRKGIEDAVNDTRFQDKIRLPLEDQLTLGLKGIRQKLISRLDSLKIDFEAERVREPETQFGKSLEERKRIAEENRTERINVIEPLRKRIEAFAQTVTKELAK